MAKAKYYLDLRNYTEGKEAPLKLILSAGGKKVNIPTGISLRPENWDGGQVVLHPRAKTINMALTGLKGKVDTMILNLTASGQIRNLDANDIKRLLIIEDGGDPDETKEKTGEFERKFLEFAAGRRAANTRTSYNLTLRRLHDYDPELSKRKFTDIDKKYLRGFEEFYSHLSRNTVNIYLRNIRAVFNDAIDDELTTAYPFRKIKIKAQATKDRSMSAEDLRRLFNYPCAEFQQEYVDIFKLTFFLCGINMGDLYGLDKIYNGRIEYDRNKTGKHYSIRVEPEALAIIEKYKGEKKLLSIADRYRSHLDYLHHFNDGLKTVGKDYSKTGVKPTGAALFPEISSYYARVSWATIAAELDIPKETIAAALGHTQMDVTAIYIRTDMKKKIDAANRKVIDYVLYGK